MNINNDTHAVREVIRKTLPELGFAEDLPCCETVLIRDGFYAGRRFDFGVIKAIWAADEPQVAFLDENGELLRVVEWSQPEIHEMRRAA